MPTYLWQGKFHNSNSRNQFIRNMTFMKIVQFFWYTVLQGTMMQFSHLFDAPLLTPLASILVGNYLFQGRFKSHFCYCLLQNMAIRVVEFSNGGYKIRKIFAKGSTNPTSPPFENSTTRIAIANSTLIGNLSLFLPKLPTQLRLHP